jgi:hypothetical protein
METDDVMHRIYAISDERRITNPAVAAISRAAREASPPQPQPQAEPDTAPA